MGTLAGLDFTNRLIQRWRAIHKPKKEWEYPKFILWSDPTLPSRTLGILNKEDEPLITLLESRISWLNKMGVTEIYFPCNTVHYFLRKSHRLEGKYNDIINLTCENHRSNNLHILGGEGTREAKLYDHPEQKGIVTYEESTRLRHFIELVKQNKYINSRDLKEFKGYLKEDSYNVMACTEFSVLYNEHPQVFEDYDILDPVEIVIEKICNDES